MEQNKKGFDILDYLLILLKWKKQFIIQTISVFVISYIVVYFFVTPKYDSTALIIPSQPTQLNGFTSLLKSYSNFPINLGSFGQDTDVDIYKTIIYSRTNIDNVIKKFDLLKDYDLKSMEKAGKELRKNIEAEETREGAFTIKVRTISPKKSVAITNYIVEQLNKTIIELNIRKSQKNKIFLGDRYNEIKMNLSNAEDSLRIFQKNSGVLEAETQIKSTIEEYSKMEAELASKQIQLSIMEKIYGKNSPQVKHQIIAVNEFRSKLKSLQSGLKKNSILLPLNSLPDKALKYLRYYRNVKINNSMLQFIIPLYEQAKFDEQKEVPILQVIDYGALPDKKSYPPRILFSILITIISVLLVFLYLIIKEIFQGSSNPKVELIRKEFRLFNK